MAARKKTKKKPAAKSAKKVKRAATKTTARKTVRAAKSKKPAGKKPVGKKAAARPKKAAPAKLAPGSLLITVEPALLERLKHLAGGMFKTVEQIIPQALGEFADHWEDHARTVEILNSGNDRMALVVPQGEPNEEKTD